MIYNNYLLYTVGLSSDWWTHSSHAQTWYGQRNCNFGEWFHQDHWLLHSSW